MKTLRPLFGRETPGMDLSAADRAGRPALAATPTEMIAAVGTTMAATEAAWDAILAGVGDDADARAIAQLILRASRPSSDPFYDNIATLVIELALLHLQTIMCGAPAGEELGVATLRDFFRSAPAERLIAVFAQSADPTVRAAAEGVCATLLTHDRLRASAFVEAAVRVNALAYTPPPTVDSVRGV